MSDLVFLFLFQFILTIPVARKTRSVGRYFLASIISFFGVAIPLLAFGGSFFMIPPSKEHCPYGWLDCFNEGKLALTPLAFWATAALYSLDVLRVENRNRLWIFLGMAYGTIISTASFLFLVYSVWPFKELQDNWFAILIMTIPLYVTIWHWIRTVQLIRSARVKPWILVVSQIGALPFWAATYYWCQQTYLSLPDTGDGCFVVTAAGRGHRSWVGPFVEITRNGRRLQANKQLLTFWKFESHWQKHLPRSHAIFRFVYNRMGPVIAGQIKWPLLADAIYLALKPFEFTAHWINHNLNK